LQALADEMETQLAAQGIPAPIMVYGVGTKRREGFIALESAKGIPPAFVRWLSEQEDILEYVVYDIPFPWKQERRQPAAEQARAATATGGQGLMEWLREHRLRLVPDNAGGLRLVPDENDDQGAADQGQGQKKEEGGTEQ
jgi:hypothetical protein